MTPWCNAIFMGVLCGIPAGICAHVTCRRFRVKRPALMGFTFGLIFGVIGVVVLHSMRASQ